MQADICATAFTHPCDARVHHSPRTPLGQSCLLASVSQTLAPRQRKNSYLAILPDAQDSSRCNGTRRGSNATRNDYDRRLSHEPNLKKNVDFRCRMRLFICALLGSNAFFFPNKPQAFHDLWADYARYSALCQFIIFALSGFDGRSLLFLLVAETIWWVPPLPTAALFVSNHGVDDEGYGVGGAARDRPTHSVYGSTWFDVLCVAANYTASTTTSRRCLSGSCRNSRDSRAPGSTPRVRPGVPCCGARSLPRLRTRAGSAFDVERCTLSYPTDLH